MAKKRFTDGMDSLFGDGAIEVKAATALSLFPDDPAPSASREEERKGSSGKGFTSQLEAFLAEAFETLSDEDSDAAEDADTRARRPRSGLDLLIRSTSSEPDEFKPQTHTTRRVTLVFPKEHLEKLKQAAKEQNVYLKDIINNLIETYIKDKGL
jgi:hypothetical protein